MIKMLKWKWVLCLVASFLSSQATVSHDFYNPRLLEENAEQINRSLQRRENVSQSDIVSNLDFIHTQSNQFSLEEEELKEVENFPTVCDSYSGQQWTPETEKFGLFVSFSNLAFSDNEADLKRKFAITKLFGAVEKKFKVWMAQTEKLKNIAYVSSSSKKPLYLGGLF